MCIFERSLGDVYVPHMLGRAALVQFMFDGNQGGCIPEVHNSSAPLSLAPCSHLSRLRNQVSLFSEVRHFPAPKGPSSFMHLSLSDMLGVFLFFPFMESFHNIFK